VLCSTHMPLYRNVCAGNMHFPAFPWMAHFRLCLCYFKAPYAHQHVAGNNYSISLSPQKQHQLLHAMVQQSPTFAAQQSCPQHGISCLHRVLAWCT
jgi:hypothetical protein